MNKRGNKSIGLFEIVLMIFSSFAIAFILNGSLVSGQLDPYAEGGIFEVPKEITQSRLDISPTITQVPAQAAPPVAPPVAPAPAAGAVASTATIETFQAGSTITQGVYSSGTIISAEGAKVISGTAPSSWTASAGNEVSVAVNSQGNTVVSQVGGKTVVYEGQGVLSANSVVAGSETAYEANFGLFKLPVGSGTGAFFGAHLLEGLVWGGIVALGIKLLGPSLGLSEEQSNSAAIAAFGGIVSGKILYGFIGPGGVGSTGLSQGAALFWSGALGVGVAFAILAATYKKEKKKLVSFQCLPYEPPLGGKKCEECNKDSFRPCSEYRCRSLGQACSFENADQPGNEICVWKDPKDAVSPTIKPWSEALKPIGLSYNPDNTIRPPNRGVKIVSKAKDRCLQAFTPLEFGVQTNEPAKCKVDYSIEKNFDDMAFYFGGVNYLAYNHSQKMKLPGPDNNVGNFTPELENDGTFSLAVRCMDANGNQNVDAFVFNFCVDKSPDVTPPLVEGSSIVNNGFIRFNSESVPIEIYVNEPAECKWSRVSKGYEQMENQMKCDTESFQVNADLNYVCRGNLTGIKNKEDNLFFFRCKDQPGKAENERNVMTTSYELNLKGTQELNILNVGPNETIFGSTDTIPVDLTVRTDDGAEEGKAICYFSNTGKPDSYIAMFETNNFVHKQTLDLVAGNYKFFYRCVDAGGNSADANTSFSVFIDKEPPKITRAYKDEGLKIVTDEDAECVYDLKRCNYEFKEGLPFVYINPSNKKNHIVEWSEDKIFYVKCRDLKGNEPSPNSCGIVVKGVELKGGR